MTDLTSIARALACIASLTLPLAACSSTDAAAAKPAASPSGLERDTKIVHEPCDADSKSAVKVDVNGDGKPDIIHVMDGAREVCGILDLNLDGSVDEFIYYDAQGRVRRTESDFDRDGRADEIAIYKDGALVMKERETNFDDKLDTWDYYENGRLVRRERDSDGDGIIDQWWTFNNPTNPACALVATDANSDGKPDPNTVVDLCADRSQQVAAPAPKASATADAGAAPSLSPSAAAASAAPSAPPPSPSAAASAAPAVATPTPPKPAK